MDLSTQTARTVEHSENWYRLFPGGGLMGTKMLLDDTEPGLDCFDPASELIFVSGAIAGQKGPGLARFSIVCKSPLSGGIGEARGGRPLCRGFKGQRLRCHRFHRRIRKARIRGGGS